MGFGLKNAGAPKAELDAKVAEAARMLKLEPLLDRKPAQLSGGQRQRVAIGRAIVRRPEVFLFDEPLSNLDAALRVGTRAEIAKLHRDLGATMIYVTHDQVEAMTLADKIVVLEAGEVRATGKASITVEGPAAALMELPINPADCKNGETLTLGIRPKHISAEISGRRGVAARVNLVELLDHQTYVKCQVEGNESMSALFNGNMIVSFGDELHLFFRSEDCHLFRTNGQALKRQNPPSIRAR